MDTTVPSNVSTAQNDEALTVLNIRTIIEEDEPGPYPFTIRQVFSIADVDVRNHMKGIIPNTSIYTTSAFIKKMSSIDGGRRIHLIP